MFLEDFNSFLSSAATMPHEFIITSDFGIYLDNPTDHLTLPSFYLSFLLSTSVNTQIFIPTTKTTLIDLVITSSDSSLAQAIFLLELGQTDRQTDKQTRLNGLFTPAAIQPVCVTYVNIMLCLSLTHSFVLCVTAVL